MINIPENLYIAPESSSTEIRYYENYSNRLLKGQVLDYRKLTENDPRLNFLSLYDIESVQIDEQGESVYSRIGFFASRKLILTEYEKITGLINPASTSCSMENEVDLYLDNDGIVTFNIGDGPNYSGYIVPASVEQIYNGFNTHIHFPVNKFLTNLENNID